MNAPIQERERRAKQVFAERRLRKLERQAGRADRETGKVLDELAEAEEVFAKGDYVDLTFKQLGAAGRRIARLADQLRAAEQLPAARRAYRKVWT